MDLARVSRCFGITLAVAFGSLSADVVAQCEIDEIASDYSLTDAAVELGAATPGGLFFGPGVDGNRFDPGAAGAGTHQITYTKTDDYSVSRAGTFAPVTDSSGWQAVPSASGGALSDVDDGLSPAIDLGFTFSFFGQAYRQVYVSSNGAVFFEPYDPSPWRSARIPERQAPNNMIALVRADLDTEGPANGRIRYRVDGQAPNRVFVLDYAFADPRDEEARGAGDIPNVVTQLKLFETSHRIEIHTREFRPHGDWDGDDWADYLEEVWGDEDDDDDRDEDDDNDDSDRDEDGDRDGQYRALQGIENGNGSRAYFIPGRNNRPWIARNDFVAFTGCSDSLTVRVAGDAYTIGGQVTGLAPGNRIVLQNNAQEELQIDGNGPFTFATALADSSGYSITVAQQPESPRQTCVVENGSGFISGRNIIDVSVSCASETYRLDYSAGPNGRIEGEASQVVQHGDDGSAVTAVPDDGYRFDGWSDGVEQNPRTDTEIAGPVEVSARFVATGQGGPPVSDDQPPVFGELPTINLPATGLLSARPELTAPVAIDEAAGDITATLATDLPDLLRPGRYQLTWVARDTAGNRAVAEQVLQVHPLISLARDQDWPEGSPAKIRVLLNGQAPDYPLTVGYSVSGSASQEDHDLAAGSVTFEQGETEQVIEVDIVDDSVSDSGESLVVSLDEATTTEGAANFGVQREHVLTLVEDNLAPQVELAFYQNDRRTLVLARNGGDVRVEARVKDPNPGDEHRLEWQFPPSAIVDGGSGSTRTLSPASLDAGLWEIGVVAREEEDSNPLSASDRQAVLVKENRPRLPDEQDTDSDGRTDADEGYSDADGDGQPDYADPITSANVLSEHASDGPLYWIESEPGLSLTLSSYAVELGADGAGLSQSALAESDLASDSVTNIGGYVDFEVRGLAPGGLARVVIPQRSAVPEEARYRKFADDIWSDFAEDADDTLASAPGTEGACPPPGSDVYQPGLTPGDWCVQLVLTDGGPNDADGQANGIIVDPGGVGTTAANARGGAGSGGGGSFGDGSGADDFRVEGGGGASGSVALMALSLLAALAAGLRGLRLSSLFAGCLLLTLVAWRPMASAGELITGYHPLYLTAQGSYVKSEIDQQRLRDQLGPGVTLEEVAASGGRAGGSLGIGYRATRRVFLEVSYVNLGDVDLQFRATGSGEALASVHPQSGHGGAVSAHYRYPLTERLGAKLRLGVFIWEGEFTTWQNGALVREREGRSEEPYYGLGFDYILSPAWSLNMEVQRYEFEDPTHVATLGLEFRFVEWWDSP